VLAAPPDVTDPRQGPPGTGKTTVILHILNFLHLVQYQRYYERKLADMRAGGILEPIAAAAVSREEPDKVDLTTERASGKAQSGGGGGGGGSTLSDILKGIAGSDGRAVSGGAKDKRPKKPRILVCAPSNAAVDVLVERLLRDKVCAMCVQCCSRWLRRPRVAPSVPPAVTEDGVCRLREAACEGVSRCRWVGW